MLTLRFDMRTPDWAAPAAELYAAAVDMCAWAEGRGVIVAVLSEHHATDDGHLPTPMLLAAAIAARTTHTADTPCCSADSAVGSRPVGRGDRRS